MTINKHITKAVAATVGTPLAKSVLVSKGEQIDLPSLLAKLGGSLPIFVKPNTHGSSFGVSKVKKPEDLEVALAHAFELDTEDQSEQFMPGREFGQGAFRHKGKVMA